MKFKSIILLCAVLPLLLQACIKDRTFPETNPTIPPPSTPGAIELMINEYMAKESKAPSINEFGRVADWFEIYNPGDDTVKIDGQKFFVSDDAKDKGKYRLPASIVLPKGYLVIWCDNTGDTSAAHNDIHATFALSSGGESLGVYMIKGSDTIALDTRTFTAQTADVSEGRSPDGGNTWKKFSNPTPGKTNE